MVPAALPTRRDAILGCAFAALTVLVCAGLLGAAALAPAPPAVLPFIVAICIGCPMVATWSLPGSIAMLRACRAIDARARSVDARDVARMRRSLERLPETDHPLGL